MADNVAITAGSGTSIATDDISNANRHYQRMKLSDGTADSEVHLRVVAEDSASADGDTGLIPMAVRRAAPTNSSGADGDYEPLQMNNGRLWVSPLGLPFTAQTDVTRPADTTAYANNDALSNSTTAPTTGGFTLSNVARVSGGHALITDVIINSSNTAALSGELFLFNQAVTNINDNAAFTVTDAEIKTCVGRVPFTVDNVGANAFFQAQNLSFLVNCVGSTNLRFLIRVKGAYTPTSSEVITVTVKGVQID